MTRSVNMACAGFAFSLALDSWCALLPSDSAVKNVPLPRRRYSSSIREYRRRSYAVDLVVGCDREGKPDRKRQLWLGVDFFTRAQCQRKNTVNSSNNSTEYAYNSVETDNKTLKDIRNANTENNVCRSGVWKRFSAIGTKRRNLLSLK